MSRRCGRFALVALTFSVLALVTIPLWPATRIVSAATCTGVSEPGTLATGPTDRFPADATEVHAVVVLAEAKAGTKVRGTWISVDAIDLPNYEIRTSEVTLTKAGEGRVHFSLANKSFPPGNYQLKVFVDGQAATLVPFVVARAGSQAAAAPPKTVTPPTKPAPQAPSGSAMSRLGAAAQAAPAAPSGALLGTWQAQGPYGIPIVLVFQSATQLVLADEPLPYTLVPGALRMVEDGRPVDYPYSVKGDQLVLGMPEGGQLQFRKVSTSTATPSPYGGQQGAGSYPGGQANQWGQQTQGYPGGYPQQGYPGGQGGYGNQGGQGGYGYPGGGGGSEWQVQGRFCTYGGSSGGGSSYSRTGWAQFDGQGSFTYGSESSFSSGAGMGYGGGPGGGGRYRVQGNVVLLQFSDGSQGQARVNMQQNDGRITELYYGSDLYSPSLCE